ncbi:hypothetical protein [Secundilactobacillus kimchicus]|uniref:Uncharacterized protein n=1 Tax=Secundilactobacillus kimchicus JCM 15530 TaxID=1302272 RepID=A0A0R1HQJ0_9LACO|nr:hypothetical protein [Secundilactobacillus kimchicus]KRK46755.1 hypothetical protein FC96_GL001387 [Secundilactobacillus kimchicus JCM 15530]
MSQGVLTAIISAVSAIAVGYVPVWVARINAGSTESPKEEVKRLRQENEQLKIEIEKLKRGD